LQKGQIFPTSQSGSAQVNPEILSAHSAAAVWPVAHRDGTPWNSIGGWRTHGQSG